MTAAEVLEIDKSFSPLFEDDANKARIRTIEEHLKFPITAPSGIKTKQFCLIGEGNLKKICRKELKDRYFALFSHCLIYCNFPPSDRVVMKKPLLKTTVLQTCGMNVEACRNVQVGDSIYTFCLKIQTAEKSFIVVTETEEEQQAWENHIQCAIIHSNFNNNKVQKKSKGGSGTKREAAPVWIPDQNFTVCPVCQKSKFTAINRRHHCRKCGTLMCGECQRYFEDKVKKKKEKICVLCHEKTRSQNLVSSSQLVPLPKYVSQEERSELKRQQEEAAKENRNEVPASSLVQFPKLESDSSDDDYDSSDE